MRDSCIFPGPRPGARFAAEVPLMETGWDRGGEEEARGRRLGSCWAVVAEVGTGVEVRDEERDFIVKSAGDERPKMGFVEARLSGSPLAETSNSGKVMKKRQPKVVPKKAPSTD